MQQGERCFHHRNTPGAVILKRRNGAYDMAVWTAQGRQPFIVAPDGSLSWPHPAGVPRRLKRLAERAYRQKEKLDARIHAC